MIDNKIVDSPLDAKANIRLHLMIFFPDPSLYRTIVGSWVYLVDPRPDIAYVVHIVSQFVVAPTIVHWVAFLKIVSIFEMGFVFFLGDLLISWKSKKQDVLSRSFTEAEYCIMAVTTSEIVCVIQIACNNVFHKMTNHIK
ncbi:uncharacterized mitochondrial protein-like protein [Tanacetum coccineum]